MLETHDLSAGYEGVPALRSVDFRVGPQEPVAILGLNGAGKSTLLKTISGTVTPEVGSIRFDGQDLLALSPHQRVEAGIVHVPSGSAPPPPMKRKRNHSLVGPISVSG